MAEREILTWDLVGVAGRALAQQVDDVADTGKTLELVRDFCSDSVAEARTAVLYSKPHSIIEPDFAWRRTDKWINFPWSTEPPVTPRSGVLDA